MADLTPFPKFQGFDLNGDPLSGGLLYTYTAGTTTPKATYTDEAGAVPNTNPVVLDSRGEAVVRLASGNYKFVLQDSLGNAIWTVDNIAPAAASSSGGTGFSAWVTHNITGGQSATALTDETWTAADYTSVVYEFEIIRGTTIMASGRVYLQKLNSSWRVKPAPYTGEQHGVTFSLTGTTTQQLNAAVSAGDNGTIKLRRSLVA